MHDIEQHDARLTHKASMRTFEERRVQQNVLHHFIAPKSDSVTALSIRIAMSVAYNH